MSTEGIWPYHLTLPIYHLHEKASLDQLKKSVKSIEFDYRLKEQMYLSLWII